MSVLAHCEKRPAERESEVSYVVVSISPASPQEAYRAHAPESARSGADAVVVQSDRPPALAVAGRRGHRRHPLVAPGRTRPSGRLWSSPPATAGAAALPVRPLDRLLSVCRSLSGGLVCRPGALPAPSHLLPLAQHPCRRAAPVSTRPR